MITFKATREETDAILAIVERAGKELHHLTGTPMELIMDLDAVHSNCCPLDFAALLKFPALDFGHDIYGIRHHIDRRTGHLTDCFLPRCARLQ